MTANSQRCSTCPAFRVARDHSLRSARMARDDAGDITTSGKAAERLAGLDEGQPDGLEMFRRVGRKLAQKLDADSWMELRAVLLDDDGAADDAPLNGTETANGMPRNAIAADSFSRLFPNAKPVRQLYPTAHDERAVPVSDAARKSFAELYGAR